MRVRISIPGTYMAMDMKEEQAQAVFRKMAEMMWMIGSRKLETDKPGESMDEPESLETSTSESETEVTAEDTGALKEAEEPTPKIISSGYGGFLYIKCPVCGKVKGFCAKTRLNHFRCDCGAVTKMKNMVPLYMKCECGRQAKYLTNMTATAFDMVCYDCGAPVAVEWNKKKRMYEMMC